MEWLNIWQDPPNQVNARVFGIVLNDIDLRDQLYGYHYHYYHNYSAY